MGGEEFWVGFYFGSILFFRFWIGLEVRCCFGLVIILYGIVCGIGRICMVSEVAYLVYSII